MYPVIGHHTSQERQPAGVPELENYQPQQPSEQSHAEDYTAKPQAEKIITDEQTGLRTGRSTTEQIFNLRILCEKHLQHQQVL